MWNLFVKLAFYLKNFFLNYLNFSLVLKIQNSKYSIVQPVYYFCVDYVKSYVINIPKFMFGTVFSVRLFLFTLIYSFLSSDTIVDSFDVDKIGKHYILRTFIERTNSLCYCATPQQQFEKPKTIRKSGFSCPQTVGWFELQY